MARVPSDPEVERGRKILKTMEQAQHRTPRRTSYGWLIALMALALIGAILLLVLSNRERFAFLWQRLMRPGSQPGI
ncbi:hypothetical protein FJY69_02635 [candidate division WOR-3 bacterium]|nr:hypothetical protein [candidate division WOR-3 bacterium]